MRQSRPPVPITPAGSAKPAVASGRGLVTTPQGRFEKQRHEAFDDGWMHSEPEAELSRPATKLFVDTARTVISRNQSPDIPFSQSINPYRGCEHGCSYCYARPTHSYLGLSPGLDFETHIGYKPEAAALLRKELAHKNYRCQPIALGMNTDGWQPVERKLGITRALLEILCECRHPVMIVTKGALIERDFDILADMARDRLVQVSFSIATLDRTLARLMEPRAAAPQRRLELMRDLSELGIPTGVLFAPLIPALNDHELEAVFTAASDAGALWAGHTVLRLPHELAELFPAWLQSHFPDRAKHIMSVLRQMRGGEDNDAAFGRRMRGDGVFAQLYARRAQIAAQRLGLNTTHHSLNCKIFRPPHDESPQLTLW